MEYHNTWFLGPILLTVYTSPIAKVAVAHGVVQQLHDDMQLHVIVFKLTLATATCDVEDCVAHGLQFAWFCRGSQSGQA